MHTVRKQANRYINIQTDSKSKQTEREWQKVGKTDMQITPDRRMDKQTNRQIIRDRGNS